MENTYTHTETLTPVNTYKHRYMQTKSKKAYTILLTVITPGRLDKKKRLSLFTLYTLEVFFSFLSNDHVIHIMNILKYVCEQTLYENI